MARKEQSGLDEVRARIEEIRSPEGPPPLTVPANKPLLPIKDEDESDFQKRPLPNPRTGY